MIITLELSPAEVALLTGRAQAQGVDVEAVLHGLIAQLAPVPSGPPALADPEERAERDREAAEMQANIRRWRAEMEGSLSGA